MTHARLTYLQNRLKRLQDLEQGSTSTGIRHYTDNAASKLEAAYTVALAEGITVGPVPRTPTLLGVAVPDWSQVT